MSIEANKPLHRILYFENNMETIKTLDLSEYYPILLDYLDALFTVKSYSKYTIVAEQIASMSLDTELEKDLSTILGILYKNAFACDKIHDYKKAAHICYELLGIRPQQEQVFRLLRKTKRKEKRQNNKSQKAVLSIVSICILIAYFIKSLVIEPFYPAAVIHFNSIMMALIVGSAMYALYEEVKLRRIVERELNVFMTELQQRKETTFI